MIGYGKISEFYSLLCAYEERFPETAAPLQLVGRIKDYQNVFVLDYVVRFLPNGGRVLEIGGGSCAMLRSLNKNMPGKFECWNLDPLEGAGNGPVSASKAKPGEGGMGRIPGVKTVEEKVGVFSKSLPDDYFDLVFSISVLEHIPLAEWPTCFKDMRRVLKTGGYCVHSVDLHPLDAQTAADRLIMLRIAQTGTLTPLEKSAAPNIEEIRKDPDALIASPFEYARWLRYMNEPKGPYRRVAAGNSVYWREG